MGVQRVCGNIFNDVQVNFSPFEGIIHFNKSVKITLNNDNKRFQALNQNHIMVFSPLKLYKLFPLLCFHCFRGKLQAIHNSHYAVSICLQIKESGVIRYFVTPNFVLTAFDSKSLDRVSNVIDYSLTQKYMKLHEIIFIQSNFPGFRVIGETSMGVISTTLFREIL